MLLVAFVLRVWGIGSGLPYSYHPDEQFNFVARAIGLFGNGWNPEYFVNPPTFTYVLHVVYAGWFGGGEAARAAYAGDPSEVLLVGRVVAAMFGTLAVWLLYLAGARLFDRRVALLAAAVMAVAFLPVFYSHVAVNDVPALAVVCLALWGVARVARRQRLREYALAGLFIGVAAATKYTAGIVVIALLGAAALLLRDQRQPSVVARALAVAAGCAVVGFLVANPYAVLDFDLFRSALDGQSRASRHAKLGQAEDSGLRYYFWAATWGLGYAPLAAAAAGAVLLCRQDGRMAAILLPAPLLFIVFMSGHERFFGRWLLPIFPILCLLAGYGAVRVADRIRERHRVLGAVFAACAVAALIGQGLVHSIHLDGLLARTDTRTLTREWLERHLPTNAKIVVEPIVPDAWLTQIPNERWIPDPGHAEHYERGLSPTLIDRYAAGGYCWVIVGSTQRGRAEAEPRLVPDAVDYYRELERRSGIAYVATPYRDGADPPGFSFDWSFDYYPLAYRRPGPQITVYRLDGGRCTRQAS